MNPSQLSAYTTFQLGGPCRDLIACATPEELENTIRRLAEIQTPFILIGGGSNLVVSDHGLSAVVVRYVSPAPLMKRQDNDLIVSASTELDAVALFSVEEGLDGFIYTSGIPGTVGGAVVGNAGAWGEQVGDVLKSAVILDTLGRARTVGPDYFKFTYRHSHLKETNEIISQVTFALRPGDPVTLANKRAMILRTRTQKHPDLSTTPCAGSFFRNVEPSSKAGRRSAAGWFLEQAGAKNLSSGGAQIFAKHANIIVKGPDCTAQDVHDLHLKMISAVKAKFGFNLKREARFVGKFKNTTESQPQGFW